MSAAAPDPQHPLVLVAPAADPARAHERFVGGTTVSSRADAWEGQRIMTIAGERSPSTPRFGAASSASSFTTPSPWRSLRTSPHRPLPEASEPGPDR
jgi:hypothetical protein